MSRAASSSTRWSIPSYRPQAKISRDWPASSWASAWVNGTPAGYVPGRHDRPDERDEHVPAFGQPYHEQVGGGPVVDPDHLAQRLAVDVHHGEADELEVVELVRVVGVDDLGGVHAQPHAAQVLGAVSVQDALERDDQTALVRPDRLDAQRGTALGGQV